jgi:hypothetical protein
MRALIRVASPRNNWLLTPPRRFEPRDRQTSSRGEGRRQSRARPPRVVRWRCKRASLVARSLTNDASWSSSRRSARSSPSAPYASGVLAQVGGGARQSRHRFQYYHNDDHARAGPSQCHGHRKRSSEVSGRETARSAENCGHTPERLLYSTIVQENILHVRSYFKQSQQ